MNRDFKDNLLKQLNNFFREERIYKSIKRKSFLDDLVDGTFFQEEGWVSTNSTNDDFEIKIIKNEEDDEGDHF